MTKKTNLIYSFLLILIISSLLFVSCNETAPIPATQKPIATSTAKYGGILKIGTSVDGYILGYPPGQLAVQDFVTSKECVESLGRYDEKGLMVPWLAEGWKTDANAKTITISLKKGIKFHDGTDFNAEACKWNIDKFIQAKRAEIPGVTSIDVIDDYTVRINLSTWDNTVIIGMGYYAGPQISPTAWKKSGSTDKERDDWATNNPVGTGPFQFVSRNRDLNQIYKKFDGYWQKGKPYLDGIQWNFIKEPLVLQASFRAKEIDEIWNTTALVAKDLKAAGFNITELRTGLGQGMVALVSNSVLQDSPFVNVKARQAISYAIDPKIIVDTQYYGYAESIKQWGISSGYWANPNFKGYEFNPDKAKQLVAEAGYPNGIKTKFVYTNTPETAAICQAIQAMLAKAGINAELDPADNARYRQITSTGTFEGLCYTGTRANSDLAAVMPRNLSSKGVLWTKNIIHPDKIEKLLVEAKQAPDQESKRAKIWELQQVIFGEYCIFTPLWVPSGVAAKQSYVRNDGLMNIELSQWTPEDAWLDK